MPEPLPVQIGKYPITRVLGEGGMGIVFLGRDPGTDRDVAVKTIKADVPEAMRNQIRPRFAREARAGRLQHDNIVTLYESGEWDGGRPYIAMEYIDGEPLDKIMLELLRAGKRLPLVDQLDIVRQVCEGLDYAHQENIFHRDIKPANIMRRRDGRVKIVDFGIARVQNSPNETLLTQPLLLIGTVAYMAPERLKGGRGDGPADIFAVGVMLYYLLTGQEPFTGAEPMSVMHKVVNEPYAPLNMHLPEYPAAIDQILELALAKDPAARYSRAQEFAADLAAIINDINRGRIPGLLKDAERLVNEGRWDLASEKADEVTRIDPQNAKAREISRRAGRGRRDEADQEKVRTSLLQAQSFAADGRYEQAIQIFEELVRRRPGDLDFQAQLEDAKGKIRSRNLKESRRAKARELRLAGDFTGAIQIYDELVALNPADSQLHEEQMRLKKEVADQEQRIRTDRHIENARQAVGAQRYTDAIAILEDIHKLKTDRPEVDRLYQEALKGRKYKDDERYREQVVIQARKLRSVGQYDEALAELDQGLLRLPGDASLLRLRHETDREAKDTTLRAWIAGTVEKVSIKALAEPGAALAELRQSMKDLPGEERFELLEAELQKRIKEAETQQRRAACLRDGGEALYAGDPGRAKQIVQQYLLKHPSDEEIDRLLREVQTLEAERELERRSADFEARCRSLLDQGRLTDAIAVLQPALRETWNSRLARLLNEAQERKSEIDAITGRLGPRLLDLRQSGKQEEAIALIEGQDAAVLQNPVLQKILEELRKELNRNRALADAVSRSQRAVENGEWATAREPLEDIRRVFSEFDALTRALADFESMRTREADRLTGQAVAAANAAVLTGDKKAAVKSLGTAGKAVPYATPAVAEDWKKRAEEFNVPVKHELPAPAPVPKVPTWAVGALALVLLTFGIFAWKFFAPRGAFIQITRTPPNATVLIEGDAPVMTDASGQARVPVKPGHHAITVSEDGYTSYSDSVDVGVGETVRLQPKLDPTATTGTLVVEGTPEDFRLFVDGDSKGKHRSGDRIQIPEGRPTIKYEADGFEPSQPKQIAITRGKEFHDTFNLEAKIGSPSLEFLKPSPSFVGEEGGTVTLQWRSANMQSVTLNPGGSVDKAGKKTVNVTKDVHEFTLTAVGNDNKTYSKTVSITIIPPGSASVQRFDALPKSANPGESITLSWSTNDATTRVAISGVPDPKNSGQADVRIPKTASGRVDYLLTATGKDHRDATAHAYVDIIPPPVAAAPAPAPVLPPAPALTKAAPPTAVPPPPAPFDSTVLRAALANFEGVFKNASGRDKKACTGALDTLLSVSSKKAVGDLKLFCDAASVFSAADDCSNAKPTLRDDNARATLSCNITISYRLKDGGNNPGTPIPSTFDFTKNSDGSWKVEKWDPRK